MIDRFALMIAKARLFFGVSMPYVHDENLRPRPRPDWLLLDDVALSYVDPIHAGSVVRYRRWRSSTVRCFSEVSAICVENQEKAKTDSQHKADNARMGVVVLVHTFPGWGVFRKSRPGRRLRHTLSRDRRVLGILSSPLFAFDAVRRRRAWPFPASATHCTLLGMDR